MKKRHSSEETVIMVKSRWSEWLRALLCRSHGDVGRLLTSVAAAARHGNGYNNNDNNNGGGGGASVSREDADGRRGLQMSGSGKPGTGVASTGDDVDRPLNLEIHKRVHDANPERTDSRNVERDSLLGA